MEKVIDGVACVSAAQAAEELNTTPLRVLMLLKQEALAGSLFDGEWFVTKESLACLKRHGLEPLQQKDCGSGCSSGGCGCKG